MSQGGKGWKISTPSEGGKTRDKVAAVAGLSGAPARSKHSNPKPAPALDPPGRARIGRAVR